MDDTCATKQSFLKGLEILCTKTGANPQEIISRNKAWWHEQAYKDTFMNIKTSMQKCKETKEAKQDGVDIVFYQPSICMQDPENFKNIKFLSWGHGNI